MKQTKFRIGCIAVMLIVLSALFWSCHAKKQTLQQVTTEQSVVTKDSARVEHVSTTTEKEQTTVTDQSVKDLLTEYWNSVFVSGKGTTSHYSPPDSTGKQYVTSTTDWDITKTEASGGKQQENTQNNLAATNEKETASADSTVAIQGSDQTADTQQEVVTEVKQEAAPPYRTAIAVGIVVAVLLPFLTLFCRAKHYKDTPHT